MPYARARSRSVNGLEFKDNVTVSIVEDLSYQVTESALHEIIDRLDTITGVHADKFKKLVVEAHKANLELESLLLEITDFYTTPSRYNEAAEEPYDTGYIAPIAPTGNWGVDSEIRYVGSTPGNITPEELIQAEATYIAETEPVTQIEPTHTPQFHTVTTNSQFWGTTSVYNRPTPVNQTPTTAAVNSIGTRQNSTYMLYGSNEVNRNETYDGAVESNGEGVDVEQ